MSQDAEHRAVGLFFGEQAGVVFVVVLVPVDDDVFRDGSRDANGRRVQLYYDNLMKKGTESEFCGKTTPATILVAGVVLFEGNTGDIILRGPIV